MSKERQGGQETRSQSKPNHLDQLPHGRGIRKSSERQPPGVWNILERRARIHEERSSNRRTSQEYDRERSNLIALEDDLDEKGSARDKLILGLYTAITKEPTGTLPILVDFRELSVEEFQQFRSKVEPMSDDEIREDIRKAEEEFRRKSKEKPGPPFPTSGAVTV